MGSGGILSARTPFIAFLAVTCLLAVAIAGVIVHLAREGDQEQRARNLMVKSEIVALHAERIFLGARTLLVETRQIFEDALEDGLPIAEAARLAIDSHRHLPSYVRGLLIVDAEGLLVADEIHTGPGLVLADRQYFRELRFARGPRQQVFGEPTIGRVSRLPIIPVARRLENPDGSFAGVVSATVDPEAVRSFYRRSTEEYVDAILIIDNTGRLLFVWRSREDFAIWPSGFVPDEVLGGINASIITNGASVAGADGSHLAARLGRDVELLAVALSAPQAPWWEQPRYQLPFLLAVLVTLGLWGFAGYMAHNERRLRRARESAEAATRAKSAFLAVVSHEVRTPLTAVLGVADLLAVSALPREQRQMVEAQRSTGKALLGILDDILDSGKIEAGSLEVDDIDYDLDDCLTDVLQLMRAKASEKGIALDLDRDPAVPRWLRGDAARLRQVLFNLLGNAVKFTEKGRVRLSVYLPEGESGQWVLEVADSGIGMSEEQLARLFAPFTQADRSIGSRFGGSGLGLFIVKGLVEGMGGTLVVESRLGEGTTVTLRLPLRRGEAAKVQEQEHPFVELPWSARVLLAEDTAVNRGLMVAGLRRMGQQVTAVEDGAKAVEAAAAEAFDLILLDVQMPVMDGLTALQRIRRLGNASASSRAVAFTADVTADGRAAYLEAGFEAVLAKPVDWLRLREEIRAAVGGADGTQTREALLDRTAHQALREAIGIEAYHELLAVLEQSLSEALRGLPPPSDALSVGGGRTAEAKERIEAVLHRLRGLGGDLGCARVAALAQHETEAVTTEILAELHRALQATLAELRIEQRQVPQRASRSS